MTIKASVLKPGYLVALKSSVRGGVDYRRVDLEAEHTDDNGVLVAKWETSRQIADPAEYAKASIARSKARAIIAAPCSRSQFGLLCPLLAEESLQQAIADARAVTDAHNAQAKRTRVEVYVLVGRIAQNDEEAARAISSELRGLLDAMTAGIKAADPDAIRDAANRARSLGQMLSPDVSERVSDAIKEARAAAKEIVKRVAKAGEAAAGVVAEVSTERIQAARFAFLDIDPAANIPADEAVDVSAPAPRGIDIEAAPVEV